MSKLLLLFLAGIFFGGTQSPESNSRPDVSGPSSANLSKSKPGFAAIASFITYSPAQFTAGPSIRFNDAEPNDTRATASYISVDAIVTGTISSSTDTDYFWFRAQAKQLYIALYNLPANYDIRLYNSAGTLLASSQNSGTTDENLLYYPATPGAPYFLQVYGYNGANSPSSYELYVYPQ